jgi:serine phosphatase RsbU (regulator of sigma subunit)
MAGPEPVPPGPGAAEHLRREGGRHRLPEHLRLELEARHGGSVALYVVDVDGSSLHLLAGDRGRVPDVIPAPIGVGPEIPPDALDALAAAVEEAIPGCGMAPLALADRALGVVVRVEGPAPGLEGWAREAALAMEIASGYTDAVHAARRHKHPQPAAEMQQNLLPPRIARVTAGEIAGGVLPGYEVAGDFIDHAEDAEGVWLAIGDAVGKGTEAGAIAAVTIGALRATRRSGGGLEDAARAMGAAIPSVGLRRHAFLTAVLALWDPASRRLRWITAGHPRPVVLRADGALETLTDGVVRPLGVAGGASAPRTAEARLGPGDRLLLYSDGLVEQPDRRTGRPLGVDAVHGVVRGAGDVTAAGLVRRLQDLVIEAAGGPLRDDVSLLALAMDGDGAGVSDR